MICTYCGAVNANQLDHILPRSRGGGDGAENITPSCYSCNYQKGFLTPLEWRNFRVVNQLPWPPTWNLSRVENRRTSYWCHREVFMDKRGIIERFNWASMEQEGARWGLISVAHDREPTRMIYFDALEIIDSTSPVRGRPEKRIRFLLNNDILVESRTCLLRQFVQLTHPVRTEP